MREPDITLEEWDLLNHSQPHNKRTLQTWAREGRIQPKPQKRGRQYWVRPDARYQEPDKARITRLRQVKTMLQNPCDVTDPSTRVLEIYHHGSQT